MGISDASDLRALIDTTWFDDWSYGFCVHCIVLAKEPGGSPRGGKDNWGRTRGSDAESVLLWSENESVFIENDPFPLSNAALVREFRAPLICKGL